MSDYAVELLAELGRLAAVRILRPPGWESPPGWEQPPGCELADTDAEPEEGETAVLHLGNNPYHDWLLDRVQRTPAVVVLHDLTLHHVLVETTLARGLRREYERALERTHGAAGTGLATARRFGFSARRDHFMFPARGWALTGQLGAVVHSEWALERVRQDAPALPCVALPMPALDPGPCDRGEVRGRLGVGDDEILLMHLGFLGPEKGLLELMAALAAARRLGLSARLAVVGEGAGLEPARAAADALGVGDHVVATGWVSADELVRLPAAADLGVVLRTPSAGETSAAVVRFLACGTPVAVGGLHQFLEWPAEAALRVTPGVPAAAELVRAVCQVGPSLEDGTWMARRRAARAAYENGHRPAMVARRMARFLETRLSASA